MSALFALAMALPLRAQTAFFENTDSPEFQGTRLLRTGILVRAEHDGSHSISANHQSERMERQALLAGLYASGSSMPEEAGMFLYGIDAAVMARVVRQEESRGPNEPARENLFFEPGRQTFAGITLCASVRCGWTAGRGKPEPALASALDSVAGSHGPVTGTTVFFHGEHMLLHLTPWFLPGATGGGLDGLYSGRQIDMDGQSGRGARIEAGAFFQHGGIAVHYESVSRKQSTRTNLQGRERLDLAGIGLLLRKEQGFWKFHFLAGAEHSSGRYAATTNDESGNPFARIEGSAARAGLLLGVGSFQFKTDLFLPEPGSPVSGRRQASEISGYVAHGNAIDPTDLRSLNLRPFPGLCRGSCSGLDTKDREHAGLLHSELSWQGAHTTVAAELRILRPLRPQEKARGNPLRTTRRDPTRTEFHEASILLGWQKSTGSVTGRYSRMRGRQNGKSFLAAESIEISFLRYL